MAAKQPPGRSEYLTAFATTRRFKNLFLAVLALCLLAQLIAYVLVAHAGLVDAIHSIKPADPAAADRAARYEAILLKALAWTRFVGFVSALLLSLTLSFTARISLVDRLGGVSGFVPAMFWSLLVAAMVTPWQDILSAPHAWGALTDYLELVSAVAEVKQTWGAFEPTRTDRILHVGRMAVYPGLALLGLLIAQFRFARGYRRLGVSATVPATDQTV